MLETRCRSRQLLHFLFVDRRKAYADQIRKRVAVAFPNKEILIGETGWPSAGRMREGALPVDAYLEGIDIVFYRTAGEGTPKRPFATIDLKATEVKVIRVLRMRLFMGE